VGHLELLVGEQLRPFRGGTLNPEHVKQAIETGIVPIPVLPEPAERKAIRRAAGISCRGLARIIGCDHQSLSNWESGAFAPRQRHDVIYRRALAAMQAAR
jgi:DNA-binding transcriptional regulator YiaG